MINPLNIGGHLSSYLTENKASLHKNNWLTLSMRENISISCTTNCWAPTINELKCVETSGTTSQRRRLRVRQRATSPRELQIPHNTSVHCAAKWRFCGGNSKYHWDFNVKRGNQSYDRVHSHSYNSANRPE
jgi:hypothetical protein